MIKITEYMTRPVITARPTDSIRAAVAKMDRYNIGSLVLMHDKRIAGIVTERDVIRKAVARKLDLDKTPVKRIMTGTVQAVRLDANLVEVASMMKRHTMRRLVVTNGAGKPVGIVTSKDIIDLLCT